MSTDRRKAPYVESRCRKEPPNQEIKNGRFMQKKVIPLIIYE